MSSDRAVIAGKAFAEATQRYPEIEKAIEANRARMKPFLDALSSPEFLAEWEVIRQDYISRTGVDYPGSCEELIAQLCRIGISASDALGITDGLKEIPMRQIWAAIEGTFQRQKGLREPHSRAVTAHEIPSTGPQADEAGSKCGERQGSSFTAPPKQLQDGLRFQEVSKSGTLPETDDIASRQFDALKNRRIAPAVLIPPIGDGRLHSGTNVPGNVPYWYAVEPDPSAKWFVPSANPGADDWVERFRLVRQRIDQFSISAERSKATLSQSHYPGMASAADEWLLRTRNDGAHISLSDGHSLPPVIGFGRGDMVLPAAQAVCPFAFKDAKGHEILYANSTAVPCRLGLNRTWCVEHWSGPLERLIEEASEALLSMPGNIASKYWALWPQGFSVQQPNYSWVDLLFECGWRTGRIRRHVQIGNSTTITHLPIRGPELFPTVDSVMNEDWARATAPHETFRGNGEYVNGFVCTIDDIVSESIRFLDELLATAAEEKNANDGSQAKKATPKRRGRKPDSATTDVLRLYLEDRNRKYADIAEALELKTQNGVTPVKRVAKIINALHKKESRERSARKKK